MKTTMIKTGVLVVALFVTGLYSLAGSAQQQYKEVVYTFSFDINTAEPAAEDCLNGVAKLAAKYKIEGINPVAAGRVKIYSVDTSEKKGKIVDGAVKEIGEMLLCQDGVSYLPDVNLVPIYYEITLGNKTFKVTGGGTSELYPDLPTLPGGLTFITEPGFPTPTRAVTGAMGTVLSSLPGRRGGGYSDSRLDGNPAEYDDGLTGNVISILRVLLPVNP